MSSRNRVVVVTGASSGIGRAAALAIGERGDHVAVVGRNPERTRAAAADAGGEAYVADFDRFDEVRGLAAKLLARYDRIDVLVNNAGGIVSEWRLTPDGHERTLQSNLLAPFLLTQLLLPRLEATAALGSGPVRVLATASLANRWGELRLDDLEWAERPYRNGWPAYAAVKLATVMWVRELAERVDGVAAYSVHPGIVATQFGDASRLMRLGNLLLSNRVGRSAASGAAPLITFSSTFPMEVPSGTYFSRFHAFGTTGRQAADAGLRHELFELLLRLTGPAGLTTAAADGTPTGTSARAAR